jgi:hypothetical protein
MLLLPSLAAVQCPCPNSPCPLCPSLLSSSSSSSSSSLLQVDAGGVSIASSWDLVLQRCVEEVAAGLDFGDDTAPHIRARVHKLLLCTQEGHFQRHQVRGSGCVGVWVGACEAVSRMT